MAENKELTSKVEWETAMDDSLNKPVLLFKHSTTCPISAGAWREYQSFLADSPAPDVTYTSVKVIEEKPLSNLITEQTGVTHQSPQVILIKNKEVIWNASHGNITKQELHKHLNQ